LDCSSFGRIRAFTPVNSMRVKESPTAIISSELRIAIGSGRRMIACANRYQGPLFSCEAVR